MTKPFNIPRKSFLEAFLKVKQNRGACGIDEESISDFEKDLKNNLYKIWNRMSSGSYFPPPVLGVDIPKKDGSKRRLGIPTVSDRVCQMVVKIHFEPLLEPIFHPYSYGYRPNKSALDAVGTARKRCWKRDWVIDLDIKGFFDTIDHDLLMKAVERHTQCPWILLYIRRWLKAPTECEGNLITRVKGTPQGGVISPLLANLFLHYVFDIWMVKYYPEVPFERYADDGLIHCDEERQAKSILHELHRRFKNCHLELHPEKTKIIYFKDSFENISFNFLEYCFRPRLIRTKYGKFRVNFLPAISREAIQNICGKLKLMNLKRLSGSPIDKLAEIVNPFYRGWINYFGKFSRSSMKPIFRQLELELIAWAIRKYKRFRYHKLKAIRWLGDVYKRNPNMFVVWVYGYKPKVQ